MKKQVPLVVGFSKMSRVTMAINDHSLLIELKQPFPAFLGLLTMRYCSVVPVEGILFFNEDFRSNTHRNWTFQV